jgi:hypothetical protein
VAGPGTVGAPIPFSLDPEVAAATAEFFGQVVDAEPLPVGDIEGRRRRIEAVHAGVYVAQPIPAGIRTVDYHTKSADGASLLLRWYTTDRARRPAGFGVIMLIRFAPNPNRHNS